MWTTVLETGTGTGSLTTSLARCVAPTGHVHTFEFHEGRANAARDDFARNGMTLCGHLGHCSTCTHTVAVNHRHPRCLVTSDHLANTRNLPSGLAHCITVEHRNTIKDGFPEHLHGMADAVFLDLPFPAPVVASAAKCLRPNGVLCSFSPCIEQVLRTSEEMAKLEMLHVTTYEFLLRLYDVGLYPINKLPPMEDNVAQGKAAGEPDDADEQDAAEDAAVEQQEGAAEDGDVEETPTRKPVLPAKRKAGQKQGRKGEHGQLFQAHSLARTVVARPTMAAKGHTGFLTFCRTQPA